MYNVDRIRQDFPILKERIYGNKLVYLDNSATTHKPQSVIDSINDFYTKKNSNVHRGAHYLSQKATSEYENTRDKVKDFIRSENLEEIVFTSGTTESINLVAETFGRKNIKQGDEIIISEMEHHSNLVPWQILCKRKNARLKMIPFDESGKIMIEKIPDIITDKTKIISVTYVSNVLGTINPVKEIVEIAHEKNIPVMIDAAQAVQHMPIDVLDIDCDFFAFSGHKMYAANGSGVLYAKKEMLKDLPTYKHGGGMISKVDFDNTVYEKIPYKFEAGTSDIASIISMGYAIDYMKKISILNIMEHEQELMRYSLEKLKGVKGLKIYGNTSNKCSIISFNIDNIHHYDAMMILDKMGIAVRSGKHCAEPIMKHYKIEGMIRASIGLYNNKQDIDRLISGLRKVQEMHN